MRKSWNILFGKIAEQRLLLFEAQYIYLSIDQYVIMPNHIHVVLILEIKAAGASPRPTITNTVWVFLRQEHHALRFRDVIIQNINLFLYVLSFVLSCSELNRKSFLFLQCSALSPKTYIYLRGTQCSDDAQNGNSVLQLCEECCFLSCGR